MSQSRDTLVAIPILYVRQLSSLLSSLLSPLITFASACLNSLPEFVT